MIAYEVQLSRNVRKLERRQRRGAPALGRRFPGIAPIGGNPYFPIPFPNKTMGLVKYRRECAGKKAAAKPDEQIKKPGEGGDCHLTRTL
jgi:hypothetical protein